MKEMIIIFLLTLIYNLTSAQQIREFQQKWFERTDFITETPFTTLTSCYMACTNHEACLQIGFYGKPDSTAKSKNSKCVLIKGEGQYEDTGKGLIGLFTVTVKDIYYCVKKKCSPVVNCRFTDWKQQGDNCSRTLCGGGLNYFIRKMIPSENCGRKCPKTAITFFNSYCQSHKKCPRYIEIGVQYKSNIHEFIVKNISTGYNCSVTCRNNKTCTHWVYNVVKKTCGIVVGIQSKINMTGFISGDRDAAKLNCTTTSLLNESSISDKKQMHIKAMEKEFSLDLVFKINLTSTTKNLSLINIQRNQNNIIKIEVLRAPSDAIFFRISTAFYRNRTINCSPILLKNWVKITITQIYTNKGYQHTIALNDDTIEESFLLSDPQDVWNVILYTGVDGLSSTVGTIKSLRARGFCIM